MIYSDRTTEDITIESIDGATIKSSSWWSINPPPQVLERLEVGKKITVEQRNGQIVGWKVDGEWIVRKADESLEDERHELRAKTAYERAKTLREYRDRWQEREDALPEWIQARLKTFHERGGRNFEVDGWGYELCVAELAALYVDSKGENSEAVDEYARVHGTSGNQHAMARALAQAHEHGRTVEQTVSALSPITGDAFYEKDS